MGDSYRPSRRDRDAPPPKSLADRMTFSGGGGDSYRPSGSQSQLEFTFQSNHPAPEFPSSNSGSRAPARSNRGGGNRGGRRDQRPRNNANGNRRGGPRRKEAPHERALLQHQDVGSPEHTYGVSDGPNRFMNVDDMSDHEEADMVESDASTDGDAPNGKHKVAKTGASRADGDAVPEFARPQWSNPDPYTACPPPSETTGVKKDVVQLIRKAKNEAAIKAIGNNAVAANDDFISFDNDEADGTDDAQLSEDDEPNYGRAHGRASQRPVQDSMGDLARNPDMRDEPYRDTYDSYQPQRAGKSKKRKAEEVEIVQDWLPIPRTASTPWATKPLYKHLAKEPEKWLHNEILDFYDFVAPQAFEHAARHNLVQRIANALCTQRWFPQDSGRIICFGSYPTGLYLPTADMDLVYASDRHFNGGPPVLEAGVDKQAFKKTLFKASNRLQRVGIATNPLVIANARVPIIKFKDRITNIDVDISFENLSGVQAQATFLRWKEEFPDMTHLVALVKQLLVMRGLNEVHSGGLGGFSIICLVVSYIQHNNKATNLGECFVGFLKYYGKDFDLARKRIQMNPPGVLDKDVYGIDGRLEQPSGLSIQDPNKPDNNISGGSRRANEAFSVFSAAYDTLTDRMRLSKTGSDVGLSLLGSILGGNYESYIKQRNYLRTIKGEDSEEGSEEESEEADEDLSEADDKLSEADDKLSEADDELSEADDELSEVDDELSEEPEVTQESDDECEVLRRWRKSCEMSRKMSTRRFQRGKGR